MQPFTSLRLTATLLGLASLGLAATAAKASAPIVNTGIITAPELVSAGMAGVLAYVPTQSGATYAWTMIGGTIPGVTQNAAVTFTAGAVGTAAVQCTVTAAGVATTFVQDVPVVASQPATPFFYGSGFSADSLANTVVGGPNLNSVYYRFQSKHACALDSIRIFFIWSEFKFGYQAGEGGTIRVDVMADDNSAAHLPTGPSLANVSYSNIITTGNYYPSLTFASPAVLQGGALYHLVFTNTDPTPVTNYVSLDAIYTNAQTAPMQGCIPDNDWAVLVKSGTSAWKTRMGFTPTLELAFADGGHQGNGYIEIWSTAPQTICGPASVRETFKVSGPSRNFTKVSVRLKLTAGTSPLTVALEEADGTVIEQGTIPAASFLESAPNWVTVTFPLNQVLASGVGYNLVLSSPADTQYSVYPMRKGADKGFSNATYFPDGFAQFTANGSLGWTGWTQWGTLNLTDSDLQFMFVP
jgi:hypothetical protein